jgi:two-component system LytT family response regulator
MANYSTILIDDEKIARTRLRRLLEGYPEVFQIIGEAVNGIEALDLIKNLKPDLIFLDIQMPGKTGFEMLQEMKEFPLVIFCTAYEEYALKAFDTMAVDYLVKPVMQDRLALTVEKLKRVNAKFQKSQMEELIELMKQHAEPKNLISIPIRIGERVILIKPEKVAYLIADEKYVDLITLDGKKYTTNLSLKKMEERLPFNFKRIHRSIVVNSDHIKEFRKYFRGTYIVELLDENKTTLETGRAYAEEIRDLMSMK